MASVGCYKLFVRTYRLRVELFEFPSFQVKRLPGDTLAQRGFVGC
jgi:hypothetical protein